MKNHTSFRSIDFFIIASISEAAAENITWKPTVALTTIGSTFSDISVNIIVVVLPRAKTPPLKPPQRDPKQISKKNLEVPRGYSY